MKRHWIIQCTWRRTFSIFVCLCPLACSSKAPEPSASSPTASPLATSTPSVSAALYDASNLAATYPSLINVPELEPCKSAGNAFIRGKFSGVTINRCTTVKVETGWCDLTSIATKFASLGTVKLKNPSGGIPNGLDPSGFFSAAQSLGWLPDQCGTVDAGAGAREPVVFMYRAPKDGAGLGVMPVCLPLGPGAPTKFKDQNLCEI